MYRKPIITGWIIFAASSLYLVSFCHYGMNLWDEGGLYQGGLRYLHGQRVYEDFHGYVAGRYLLAEAAFRLFGIGMMPVRYVLAVGTALFAVFAFQIGRRIMPPAYTLMAVLLVLSAPAVYYQRFYGFAFLFNMWAIMVFMENRRNAGWVVASALYAYMFKNEVLLVTVPVYLYLAWLYTGTAGRKLLAVSAVVLIPLLAYMGDFADIIRYRLPVFFKQWSNPMPVPWKAYQGGEFGFFPFIENMLFYLPFITGTALVVVANRNRDEAKRRALAVLGYLQITAMSLVVMRAGFDNLVRCLPLFFIVAVYLSYVAVRSFAQKPGLARALGGLLSVIWVLYMADFNAFNGFYTGSIGALRRADAVLSGGRAAGIRLSGTDAGMVTGVVRKIERDTQRTDPILALPLNPIWYFLADRKNPTYYDWVLPATFARPEDEKFMLKQLAQSPPALVVFVDIEIDNRPERSLRRYAPLLAK